VPCFRFWVAAACSTLGALQDRSFFGCLLSPRSRCRQNCGVSFHILVCPLCFACRLSLRSPFAFPAVRLLQSLGGLQLVDLRSVHGLALCRCRCFLLPFSSCVFSRCSRPDQQAGSQNWPLTRRCSSGLFFPVPPPLTSPYCFSPVVLWPLLTVPGVVSLDGCPLFDATRPS